MATFDKQAYMRDWRARNEDRVRGYAEKHRDKRNAWKRGDDARRREASRELLRQLKSEPCSDCGQSYPPYVMDFDHRDPNQKCHNVGRMSHFSLEKILAEVEKCDLVCANCHRERTHGGRSPSLP